MPIGIGHDKNGSIYIAGYTYSPDFPLVGTAYSGFLSSTNQQAFTTVMNPLSTNGNLITYSGYFSGNFGDYLKAMAVDSEGVFYLAGYTDDLLLSGYAQRISHHNGGVRAKFCLRPRHQAARHGRPDLFDLLRRNHDAINPPGSPLAGGKIYVTGYTNSDDYPVTANAYQSTRPGGTFDGFVAEFDPSQSGTASLVASTYLGGSGQEFRDPSPSPRTARCGWRAIRARATSPPLRTPSVRSIPAAEMPSSPGWT